MNIFVALLLAVVMASAAGCSFSASSESSSDSSRSSSGSSSPDSKEASYRDDVRDSTEAYVKSGGQLAAFQRRIGELAKKHDITNWEDSMATYEGIGAGLRRARVNQTQVDSYKQLLGQGDARKASAIQEAYDARS